MAPRLLLSLPPALGGTGAPAEAEPASVLWQRGAAVVCEEAGRSEPVQDLLTAIEDRLRTAGAGARAVGFLSYEHGAALDPLVSVAPGARPLPDAWWAVLAPRTARPAPTPRRWRRPAAGAAVACSLDDAAFAAGVVRVRAGIAAGDCYQVNLTRRWSVPLSGDPLSLFTALCGPWPPRYATFLADRRQGWAVLCLSPELLLRRRGDRLESRPIKGTRPLGRRGPHAPLRDLRGSEKDAAELAMIVDLVRHDLNRVCLPGSVRVARRAGGLATRDVVHLEARVVGRQAPGTPLREVLAAVFPGGSVTGAPKLAACAAISRLEPVPRSVYCGALGVIGAGGDLELALPIRTGYAAAGTLHFHAGCGIVWDSDAAAEERESLAKVRSWMRALGVR
jgi:anthranilate/para-aminobenzoate synthase component I